MKKYSRLLFLALLPFLSFLAGRFADESLRYATHSLPGNSRFYFITLVLTIAAICLTAGVIMIFRQIGSRLDSIQTRIWLLIGSFLAGLGAGWAFNGILLMIRL